MLNKPSDLRIAAEAYARWSNETRSPNLARRTARRQASFVLPHLTPGMRLLDCGCGPGSITAGLAAAIAPGDAVGIDLSETAIERAQQFAGPNLSFATGDVYALPFEGVSFDAVFSHALLQHLAEPARAVREMARVLKPGGLIALADFDYGGGYIWPNDPLLERSVDIMGRLHEADGRSPYVGRELASLLVDAGLTKVTPHVSAGLDSPATTPGSHAFAVRYYEAAPVRDYVVMLGLADRASVEAFPDAWRRWSEHPGAIWVRLGCTAIGWKPL